MLRLILVAAFVIQWFALLALTVFRGRWLSVSEIEQLGTSGYFREIYRQMTPWGVLLVCCMVVTFLGILFCPRG